MKDKISWEKEFTLVTNRFVLKDLFKVILITTALFQLLIVLMIFFSDGGFMSFMTSVYMDMSIIIGFSLLAVFSMLLLGNRYAAKFTVDIKGITYVSGLREKRINRAVLILTLLIKPKSSGAAFLATSNESDFYEWKNISRLIPYSGPKVIEIKNSWRTVVRLYCTEENFEKVLKLCRKQLKIATE